MGKIIGVNNRCYPSEPIEGSRHDTKYVTTVLVKGSIDDYAAYEGIGSEEWIAAQGHKLPFEEAVVYFPWIVKDKYRR